jgi:DNA polymerase-1
VTFDKVDIDKATHYAAEDADVTLRLWHGAEAAAGGREADHASTSGWSGRWSTCWRAWKSAASPSTGRSCRGSRASFAQGAAALEDEIYKLAGERFNIGSPKQLGDILFGKMGLSGGTKTKTGQWSTSASVLEDLAASPATSCRARSSTGAS